jgi:DNA-binding beta-propeller fold protein YncE
MSLSCSRSGADSPVVEWGVSGRGDSELAYPRVLARDPVTNRLALIDKSARVQIFNPDGSFVIGWTMPDYSGGKPVGATFDFDGRLWIADTHYHRVMVYSPQGELLKQFGKQGTNPGEFVLVSDIAFDQTSGRIFISEYGDNDRVQVFDRDLNFIRSIGKFGFGVGEFSRPQSIVVYQGELFVADACNHRISVFDALTGQHVRDLGKEGTAEGELRFPYGVDVDADGDLVVSEYANGRVQWLDRTTGQSKGTWGKPGKRSGELAFPWAVAMDADGRRVWVLDSGNDKVKLIAKPRVQ